MIAQNDNPFIVSTLSAPQWNTIIPVDVDDCRSLDPPTRTLSAMFRVGDWNHGILKFMLFGLARNGDLCGATEGPEEIF